MEYFLTEDKYQVVEKLDEALAHNIDSSSHLLFIVAATIYYSENNFEAALRLLQQADDLEW